MGLDAARVCRQEPSLGNCLGSRVFHWLLELVAGISRGEY